MTATTIQRQQDTYDPKKVKLTMSALCLEEGLCLYSNLKSFSVNQLRQEQCARGRPMGYLKGGQCVAKGTICTELFLDIVRPGFHVV